MQRSIPDHFHWHIRRVDFDAHIPMFRIFGVKPIKENQLIAHGITSIEHLKQISKSLITQHGRIKDENNKVFIILEKCVQSLSEQQRPRRSTKSYDKIDFPEGTKSYSIISEIKLYVSENSDDQGIAYIEQIIVWPPIDLIKVTYRVQFGADYSKITRSVKHREIGAGGGGRDALLSELVAKL